MLEKPLFSAIALLAGLAPALAQAPVWTVERVSVDDRKAVIATVETVRQVAARTRIGGTITVLGVREGDEVAAGDRVALVVDEKLELQKRALDARIEAQRAQRDQARVDLGRMEELRRSGTVAQARLDEARTQLDVAERTLAAMTAEREVTLQQAAEGAVLAPGPGRVLSVPVAEGSVVLPGETIALIATEAYILRLQLPERHARTLRAGDTILVGARGLASAEATTPLREGRVALVYPRIEDGRVIADVEVGGLGGYFVGERTRVYVATGSRETLVVPPAAVYRRFGVSYVKLADGTEVVVQVGATTEKGTEILAGLHAGDQVTAP